MSQCIQRAAVFLDGVGIVHIGAYALFRSEIYQQSSLLSQNVQKRGGIFVGHKIDQTAQLPLTDRVEFFIHIIVQHKYGNDIAVLRCVFFDPPHDFHVIRIGHFIDSHADMMIVF